jgi:hypothetical protein
MGTGRGVNQGNCPPLDFWKKINVGKYRNTPYALNNYTTSAQHRICADVKRILNAVWGANFVSVQRPLTLWRCLKTYQFVN